MKTLYLLRHAKAVRHWEAPTDFARALKDRGEGDAALVGGHMRARGVRPQLVVSSPAERARQTASLALEAAGLDAPVRYDERIYEAGVGRLLEVVAGVEGEVEELLLVGHNPGFEDLQAHLSGSLVPMPTGALAKVVLRADRWPDIVPGANQLEWLITPKQLKQSKE